MRLWYFFFILLVGCGGDEDESKKTDNPPVIEQPNQQQPQLPFIPAVKTPVTPKTEIPEDEKPKITPDLPVKYHIDGISLSPADFAAKQLLKAKISIAEIVVGDYTAYCQWKIADEIVVNKSSDSCQYKLKENEHLQKITVIAKLVTKDAQSDSKDQSFIKIFPTFHRSNRLGICTLFSDETLSVYRWKNQAVNENERELLDDPNLKIKRIYSNDKGFALVNDKNEFFSWGDKRFAGNDEISKQLEMLDVEPSIETAIDKYGNRDMRQQSVATTRSAFAVLDKEGHAYIAGTYGVLSNKKLPVKNKFVSVNGSRRGFVFITADQLACMPKKLNKANEQHGEELLLSCQNIEDSVTDFISSSTKDEFLLLTKSGNVYSWGIKLAPNTRQPIVSNVKQIIATQGAFAALEDNGQVSVWGDPKLGGAFQYNYQTYDNSDPTTAIHNEIYDVDIANQRFVKLFSTGTAFAGLTKDGKVWTWGSINGGGNIYSDKVNHQKALQGVDNDKFEPIIDVLATDNEFTAITKTGQRIVWRGIWDLQDSGEQLTTFVYDSDVATGTNKIEGWSNTGKPIVVSKPHPPLVNSLLANNGAFINVSNEANPEKFNLYSWGFIQEGAGIDTSVYGSSVHLKGKLAGLYGDDTGFSIFSNYGDVYSLNGYGVTENPTLLTIYKGQSAKKIE